MGSNKAGEQALNGIDDISERTGRIVGEDGIIVNEADELVSLGDDMELIYEEGIHVIDSAGLNAMNSIFSDAITAKRVSSLSTQFQFGVEADGYIPDITGDGEVTIEGPLGHENLFTARAKATESGVIVNAESTARNRYIPGYEFGCWFTSVFNCQPTVDGYINAGYGDADDGFFISYRLHEGSMTFGILHRRAGSTVSFTPQSEFNVDTLDGLGESGFTLNISYGNIWNIRGGYLGFAPIIFTVKNQRGKDIVFHIIEYPNMYQLTHICNTVLPARVEVSNGSAAEEVCFQTASINLYVVDGENDEVNSRGFSVANTGTLAATILTTENRLVVAFRNKTTYQGNLQPSIKPNFVNTYIDYLKIDLIGQNKSGVVKIWLFDDTDIATENTWTDHSSDSVVAISTTVVYKAASFTTKKPIFVSGFKTTSDSIVLENALVLPELRPGQHRVYTVTGAPAAITQAVEFIHSLSWHENF